MPKLLNDGDSSKTLGVWTKETGETAREVLVSFCLLSWCVASTYQNENSGVFDGCQMINGRPYDLASAAAVEEKGHIRYQES